MNTFAFALIVSGVAAITPYPANALYAATQGDVEWNLRDGLAFLEFERKPPTPREAAAAIRRSMQGPLGP